ncbi:hypothetical protein BDQ17DRAFT_549022 [Cyathus striatus]|nr:hypothetical protein BDQ17DRAFT_549022 [Cyathus striatus]
MIDKCNNPYGETVSNPRITQHTEDEEGRRPFDEHESIESRYIVHCLGKIGERNFKLDLPPRPALSSSGDTNCDSPEWPYPLTTTPTSQASTHPHLTPSITRMPQVISSKCREGDTNGRKDTS